MPTKPKVRFWKPLREEDAMAVTESSNRNSNSPVEEGVEPPCSKVVDTGPCGLTQLSNNTSSFTDRGPPTRRQHIAGGNFGTIKRHKPRRSHNKERESDSLSDIDDAEIIGYFNNREEMRYKRILWEALNRQHTNAKKQKRTIEAKKGVPVKKAKTAEKVEVQKRSSKINYDALKALNEEFGQGSEVALNISADSSSYRAEDEHDIGYSENNGSLGHFTDDGVNSEEYGDENFDDIF